MSDEKKSPEPPRDALQSEPLGTMVAGDHMRFSLREFVHRVETLLAEEQERPLPNNALIDMLCESVRLARENSRMSAKPHRRKYE